MHVLWEAASHQGAGPCATTWDLMPSPEYEASSFGIPVWQCEGKQQSEDVSFCFFAVSTENRTLFSWIFSMKSKNEYTRVFLFLSTTNQNLTERGQVTIDNYLISSVIQNYRTSPSEALVAISCCRTRSIRQSRGTHPLMPQMEEILLKEAATPPLLLRTIWLSI